MKEINAVKTFLYRYQHNYLHCSCASSSPLLGLTSSVLVSSAVIELS